MTDAVSRRGRFDGFWTVAFAFLIVMAFATLPSPLYGLYRAREDLSAFTITVVYAVFAAGTIATLRVVDAVARRIGRRGVMLGAVATMMVASGLLAAWKDLPGLLGGRLLTGVSVGLAAGTAITYLVELRVRADPTASVARARTIGTSVNVGALGVGPLIAGCLAQWARWPLTLSYLLFVVLGAVALIGLAGTPETGAPPPGPVADRGAADSPGSVRLPVPAAAAALAAFSAMGLFAGLSGLFLATTLHRPSPALSGATLFLVFTCGVASQLATARMRAPQVLASGTASMLAGLVLLVVSVRLSTPSLTLFLLGGALIGAGAGAVFRGTTGIVLEATAPENRLAMTSALLIALFVGLSVPVIGAGVALNQGASPPDTVLWFAILVGLGISLSGWVLLGRRPSAER
ncbi:MFS transporter [Streptomyces spinoverrucosus]|uniref:MFS transporter n=1 Tax=Streptomyces spinoverrucosus TaxID=284043 RepID=UPI0018C40447|nr:MFS transporter [Streptomyces spinoverrucosus]MBG0850408.1 MFS transporter [Streptomyces spinoverrucosus]